MWPSRRRGWSALSRQDSRHGITLIFEPDARKAQAARSFEQMEQPVSGYFVREPFRPDVRQTVTFGIGATYARFICEIGAEAVGSAQTGPFADSA